MQFKDYLNLTELFDPETIRQFESEGAYWQPQLDKNAMAYRYYFNLRCDPEKNCAGKPCYILKLFRIRPGEFTITFDHATTGFKDRHTYNQGLKQKYGCDAGQEMMTSVLNGLMQFMEAVRPRKIMWSAVAKSRAGAANADARTKIYKLWAVRHILGQYVPLSTKQGAGGRLQRRIRPPTQLPAVRPENLPGRQRLRDVRQKNRRG